MMPVARMPSVKIGPMKCCMFGVRRKGTGSEECIAGCGTVIVAFPFCMDAPTVVIPVLS